VRGLTIVLMPGKLTAEEGNVRKLVLVFLILELLLVACGCSGSEKKEEQKEAPSSVAGAGDAAEGEKLFKESVIGSQPGCINCHSLEPDVTLAGPSQAGIATRAATRVAGMSAEDYLRQSILEPDAYTVENFNKGAMPIALAEELSEQQVNDLLAYLLTLK